MIYTYVNMYSCWFTKLVPLSPSKPAAQLEFHHIFPNSPYLAITWGYISPLQL